jgi:hypothetical protein
LLRCCKLTRAIWKVEFVQEGRKEVERDHTSS